MVSRITPAAFAAVAVVSLLVAGLAAAAPATDAQVKTAVVRELNVVGHQKGDTLAKALKGVRVSLAAAAPTSAPAKTAKALAVQSLAPAALAAAEQVKADQDSTRMQYDPAAAETALAVKHLAAAAKLLNKAAALLGLSQRLR
jgi:hypothetical protein